MLRALRRLRYEERAALAQNALGRSLLELMARKRTNLSVAADVATVDEMLDLADKVKCLFLSSDSCIPLVPAVFALMDEVLGQGDKLRCVLLSYVRFLICDFLLFRSRIALV